MGGPLDKDVVSFTTAILPTPTSPPPFLLLIHNEACASPCPVGIPDCSNLSFPTHPCPWVGAAGFMDVSGLKPLCLEGWVGFAPGDLDPWRQSRGGVQVVLGPPRTHPSAGMLGHSALPGGDGLPSIHGFWKRAGAVPTLRALLSFSACRHPMASALRISKPLCSSPWRNGGYSSKTPSLADHSGCCSKDMRGREGPSLLRFRMSAHHVIFFFLPSFGR